MTRVMGDRCWTLDRSTLGTQGSGLGVGIGHWALVERDGRVFLSAGDVQSGARD